MKRKSIILFTALLLISTLTFQSCIGSFSLTNKVLTWNKNVNNKFVNELVFFAFWVLPVYEVTAAADLLVINSIEFWSGNKPLEAHNKVIETENGNYRIFAEETGYKILTPEGETMNFNYDTESHTWSFYRNENEKTPFLRFKGENMIEMINYNGTFVDVELTEDGLKEYKLRLSQDVFAMN